MTAMEYPLPGESSNGVSDQEVEVYDRQLRLWGLEAQQKIVAARILIVGMSSINVESAKNLALAGFSLHLMDASTITIQHLDYNFLLRPNDFDKKTAEVTMQCLKEINPLVTISWTDEPFLDIYESDEKTLSTFIHKFSAICISAESHPLSTLVKLDQLCKQAHVALFSSLCCGKFGFIFSDLHSHHVKEATGLSQAKVGQASSSRGKKEEIYVHYPSLEETLSTHMSLFRPKLHPLFFGFFALFRWESTLLPTASPQKESFKDISSPLSSFDFVSFARQLFVTEKVSLDTKHLSDTLLRDLWRLYRCQFAPTAAILGGLLAQEVRKFVSHQHIPLPNCILFDMEDSTASVVKIP
ncbi:hypothetical protein IE077_003618 [Cardiosporidium cionae]|uniref:THIF-type NAD/FAD binding fold domain-containing protein n=1 Tax=Cardiosporidium cionae TaxID=476202 RepID=A0ABQ7J7Y8_9APIC|nr:hypothetical protein IE077_003618 [Cardiosporidium cionae]|eukprot:KAF8820068.1 hypothetical protein IE077_003618 [Cardiosporidium cionae]